MLGNNNQLKICDFGLAKVVNSTTSLNTMNNNSNGSKVGTLRWMAPEIFKQVPEYSKASDIYSLGMLFYEILDRRIPFEEQLYDSVIVSLVSSNQRPTFKEDRKQFRQCKRLIERMWLQDKNQRPSCQQIIAEYQKQCLC